MRIVDAARGARLRVAGGAGRLRPVRLRARRHGRASVHLAVPAPLPRRARAANVVAARRARASRSRTSTATPIATRRWRLPTAPGARTAVAAAARGVVHLARAGAGVAHTAVADDALAAAVARACPGARVVVTPAGVRPGPARRSARRPCDALRVLRATDARRVAPRTRSERARQAGARLDAARRPITMDAGDLNAADVVRRDAVAVRLGRPLLAALWAPRPAGRCRGGDREHRALAERSIRRPGSRVRCRRRRRRRVADGDLHRSARRGALADAGARAAGRRRGAARVARARRTRVVGAPRHRGARGRGVARAARRGAHPARAAAPRRLARAPRRRRQRTLATRMLESSA